MPSWTLSNCIHCAHSSPRVYKNQRPNKFALKNLLLGLKHHLIPCAGNGYKPGVFLKESVAALALVLFLVEGIYFFQTRVVVQRTGFLAAVLPAALEDLTNNDRVASGEKALTKDPLLAEAAQKKADDMAKNSYFAHVSPDGKTPWYWLDSVGYKYRYAGENLAVDFTDSMDIETAWMNSPEHRANIVKAEYTRIGIGIAQGVYKGEATTFVVQLFATPAYADTAPVTASAVVPVSSRVAVSASSDAARAPAQDTNAVLGAQSETVPVSASEGAAEPPALWENSIAAVASSPYRVSTWVLSAFAAVFTLLLALAIFVKRRVQHTEVIFGGTALVGLALALLFFNVKSISGIELPHDAEAASVSMAL